MAGFLISFLVGLLCMVFGFRQRKGDLNSLHSYHRSRVAEEDRLAFGRQVGLGTVLVGVGVCAFSILSAVTVHTGRKAFLLAGMLLLLAGILTGTALSFRAMKKYNKGIF